MSDLGEDTVVVLITFTSRDHLDDYANAHDLPFPVLTDPDRTAYRTFGLGRGSIRRVWGVRAGRRYLDIFRTAGFEGLRRPIEDTLQLGGDFVVAPDGTLAWGFWGEGPDDRPTVDALIDAVAAVHHQRPNESPG